jgi:hypothetical protein
MLRRLSFLLLTFALSACAQATPSPTALPPTNTPTATFTPTLTASPTPAPLPTATLTPFPTLGSGPYVMTWQGDQSQVFSMYDTNGGRKTIALPLGGHPPGGLISGQIINGKLDWVVSPDGQWLVFYTGYIDDSTNNTQLPLTLKLLNIHDGTVKTIANVVSEGFYKEKLSLLADKLRKLDPDRYDVDYGTGPEWVDGGLVIALEWGIYTAAWSPDSRTLAFAAQIDGLSLDVYLYDIETGLVQQAEDSLQNVSAIGWSPDGKKIVFGNAGPSEVRWSTSELYVISPRKKAIKNPRKLYDGGWLSWIPPDVLLVEAGRTMHTLNVNTGQLIPLWTDDFGSYAVDAKNKMIAVASSTFTNEVENLGLRFITSGGRETKIFDGLYYLHLFFRGGEKHRFVFYGISEAEIGYAGTTIQYSIGAIGGKLISVDLDGTLTTLGEFGHQQDDSQRHVSISPDYAWLLIYDDEKLYLYDKNDELVKTLPIPGIEKILWRPDSQAIFYATESDLYMLTLPAGEPKWVDSINIHDALWLP